MLTNVNDKIAARKQSENSEISRIQEHWADLREIRAEFSVIFYATD